jgi:pyruvate dehydrogenase E2 component (dihydrolipoamide acetyltransferase)
MGLEVTEANVTAIHVRPGMSVSEGDPLLEVETDKALTEVPAPRAGVVRAVEVQVGESIAIGEVLIVLGDDGESPPDDAPPVPNGRIRAAPVARRAAQKLGVDLAAVRGTGPSGRITLRDVETAAEGSPVETAAEASPVETTAEASPATTPMGPTRRAVARRMSLSAQIPQFALVREINAGWLMGEKDRLSRDEVPGLSINDLVVQSLAETVRRHPSLADAYVEPQDGGHPQLRRWSDVNVGLAVASERGLLVPVIRAADRRSLAELASDRARLVAAAREGTLGLAEMTGATVTVSNLASFAVDHFTAMINPGESAILAIGRVLERVIPRGRGIEIAPMLTLTLTFDHRVVDGAGGGAAIAELGGLLEGGMEWRL